MVRPKKHLGQHFLTDKNIAQKIVSFIQDNTVNLLEIGPGTGILTQYLLEKKIPNYYQIEIDRESVDYLKQNFPQIQNTIFEGDFLRFDMTTIFNTPFSVIGNFPYNISSQILFRMLEYRHLANEVIGMFQKEVAERIASPPGNKKYGILSVLLKAFFDIEILFTVNENVFTPPPRVKSSVIRLKRNQVNKLDCDEKLFFELVKTGFNQRRKTLRNALKKYRFQPGTEKMLGQRAEQLYVKDFIYLVNQINKE
ncbi:MAG: 16S rRNA (adenine(1518)-N(6)/adenine(1519)-N(6))-dimethyltransferase RsmA [Bacteroidales bacterium]|nr:16S rRNA (adenine(1518)-N(6)/adenine(1519)-N(6))-dimethyltransferase RsmA [Bacteroidales bacterium]